MHQSFPHGKLSTNRAFEVYPHGVKSGKEDSRHQGLSWAKKDYARIPPRYIGGHGIRVLLVEQLSRPWPSTRGATHGPDQVLGQCCHLKLCTCDMCTRSHTYKHIYARTHARTHAPRARMHAR